MTIGTDTMKQSVLQLLTSAFIRVRIEAGEDYARVHADEPFDAFGEAGLASSIEFSESPDEHGRHTVKFELELPGTEAAPTPYVLDIAIVGLFTCSAGPEKAAKYVELNGPAVLYGSIREMVMLITSRGPFGALVLPTVHFVPDEAEAETATQDPAGE